MVSLARSSSRVEPQQERQPIFAFSWELGETLPLLGILFLRFIILFYIHESFAYIYVVVVSY